MSTAAVLPWAWPAISPSRSTANGCIGWLAAFGHRNHPPAFCWWKTMRSSALDRIVFHQQNAGGWFRCPKAANQPMQPFAVDRLGEIAGHAQGNTAAVLIDNRHHNHRNVGQI